MEAVFDFEKSSFEKSSFGKSSVGKSSCEKRSFERGVGEKKSAIPAARQGF